MKMSGHAYLQSKNKAVTLIGMSGVGKTYLSGLLENWGWARYSCDYEIGNRYLAAQLTAHMNSPEDMGALSAYIGKLGNPVLGGYALDEFKKRQQAYYDAECRSISFVPEMLDEIIKGGKKNFVHDSTGSLCEITDEKLLEELGKRTLFVYLKAGEREEKLVLERAQLYPKPLFFPPAQFENWVNEFLRGNSLSSADVMNPDSFSRWVFPKLFSSRIPKYQRLADLYGVTIPCSAFYEVSTPKGFDDVIAKACDEQFY